MLVKPHREDNIEAIKSVMFFLNEKERQA